MSEQRARPASAFLAKQGVSATRFTTVGYGEKQPVADNDSEAGRQKNRRVEVAIYANDELKKAAERGDI